MSNINPRYAAYAKAHGKSPREMMHFDKKRFPGGIMAGFIVWSNARWDEFAKEIKVPRDLASLYGNEFDKWLKGELTRLAG